MKRLLIIAAAAAAGGLAMAKKSRDAKAERDLWAEATDTVEHS